MSSPFTWSQRVSRAPAHNFTAIVLHAACRIFVSQQNILLLLRAVLKRLETHPGPTVRSPRSMQYSNPSTQHSYISTSRPSENFLAPSHMDYSHIPSYSSSFTSYSAQQTPTSMTLLQQHQASSDIHSSGRYEDVLDSGVVASGSNDRYGAGMCYMATTSSSTATGTVSQLPQSTSGYSYTFGQRFTGADYGTVQSFNRGIDDDSNMATIGATGHSGYSTSAANREPSGSPEYGSHDDLSVGETLLMMEEYESPDSIPEPLPETLPAEYSYMAPQLTSPANQRAATARRKRAAKYICDMCGSKLTAKHNLTSHMNAHFGIKPFRCPHCRKEYTAKSTFRRHVKTVHQDK
ncbi:MDS1 and EVI1 complex locus protein EVI1 [Leucoagaricus sp. SymC.cos]|nr:MDS1 and EVI1 complex locus protein EVI1 [Leucoagaricus sp. SymC.cos]